IQKREAKREEEITTAERATRVGNRDGHSHERDKEKERSSDRDRDRNREQVQDHTREGGSTHCNDVVHRGDQLVYLLAFWKSRARNGTDLLQLLDSLLQPSSREGQNSPIRPLQPHLSLSLMAQCKTRAR
ncbi:hypothetical protein Taro_041972, partial [Colocasia esculenta]|nr:hypothetical protein [Colocasia esculenta]